jgi:hypothetical protein
LAAEDSSRWDRRFEAVLTSSNVCWAVVGGTLPLFAPVGKDGIVSRKLRKAETGDWVGGTNMETVAKQWKITW